MKIERAPLAVSPDKVFSDGETASGEMTTIATINRTSR